LKVGFSLGDALEINQCDPANATADLEADPRAGINIEGASFHNVGGNGVTIIGGQKASSTPVSIRSNDIHSTGNSGVVIVGGGDVKTLTSGGITVANNHIHSIGLNGFAAGIGVSLTGGSVGAVVRHNLIHHVSGKGIHGGHWTRYRLHVRFIIEYGMDGVGRGIKNGINTIQY
jgi:hypothetical protein